MNWYKKQKEPTELIMQWSKSYETKTAAEGSGPLQKLAYSSKKHELLIPQHNSEDGCEGQITLTESKNKITLGVAFYTRLYSFPLAEEVWHYDKAEMKRAMRTFNHLTHVLEDLKVDAEEEELPTPSIQGMVREAVRFIDVERKRPTNNPSLHTARYEPGEADWRKSLYGNRYPQPTIQINNNGTININNDRG